MGLPVMGGKAERRSGMGGVRGWVEGTQGLWDGKELSWGWFSLSSALGEQPRDPWASLHTLCPACALAPDGPTELCMEGKARISLMSSLKSRKFCCFPAWGSAWSFFCPSFFTTLFYQFISWKDMILKLCLRLGLGFLEPCRVLFPL